MKNAKNVPDHITLRNLPLPAKIGFAVMGVGFVAYFALLAFGAATNSGGNVFRDLYLYEGLILLSCLLVGLRAYYDHPQRLGWGLFAVGIVCWWTADTLYTLSLFNGKSEGEGITFPMSADWLYLLVYPLLLVGLWYFVSAKTTVLPKRFRYDSIGLLLSGLGLMFFLLYTIQTKADLLNSSFTATELGLLLAFPVFDLVLLTSFVVAAPLLFRRGDWSWLILLLAVVSLTFADSYYLVSTGVFGYESGTWIDMFWVGSFALFAVAAWSPQPTAAKHDPDLQPTYHPHIPLIIMMFSLTAIVVATKVPFPTISVVFFVSAIALEVWRTTKEQMMSSQFNNMWDARYRNPTTGMLNRMWLYDYGETYLSDALKNAGCTITLVDITQFREINKEFGYPVADKILGVFAAKLTRNVSSLTDGKTDIMVLHTDGNEFVIIAPAFKTPEELNNYTDSLRTILAGDYRVVDPTTSEKLSVNLDIVIASASSQPTPFGEQAQTVSNPAVHTYKKVVTAAQRAKLSHTPTVLYNPSVDHVLDENTPNPITTQTLRKAIAEGDIICYYQPIVSTEWQKGKGHVHSVEALARWSHPTLGLIPPGQSIPLAETTGLITPLTEAVITQSVRQVAEWNATLNHPVHLSVNISAVTLAKPEILEHIKTVLEEHSFQPGLFIAEITETALHNPDSGYNPVQALENLGVKISIDDYGTGTSTVSRITDLHAHEIKLDRSFVTGSSENSSKQAIIETTSHLASKLGTPLVAEGVESDSDVETLKTFNVSYMQGFHICVPQPPAQTHTWLTRNDT